MDTGAGGGGVVKVENQINVLSLERLNLQTIMNLRFK